MAPEIEWDVDTSTHSQAIIKTPPPPASPRNKILVLIVIVAGVVLGAIYRSVPEPPTPPTPTPRPIPTPVISLEQVIDQEARALEKGDPQAFMRFQDPADPSWRTRQINSFKKWGEPPNDSDLYAIVARGTLRSDRVWAEVSQARDGQYFRETRFYRLNNNQWVRAAPDYSLWGDERLLRSNHFVLRFREGDNDHAQIMAQQLEKIYDRICEDLNCTLGQPVEPLTLRRCEALDCGAAGVDPNPVPQFTLILSPAMTSIVNSGYTEQGITVTLSSPRLSGLYFQSLVDSPPGRDERIEQLAISQLSLPFFIAKIASGGSERWAKFRQGDLFVGNIGQWEVNRLAPIPAIDDTLSVLHDLKDQQLPTLDSIWNMQPPYAMPQSQLGVIGSETWSVIRFIETKYGAEGVAHFLNAIGPAQSMSAALQAGLNVSEAEFDRDWRAWLKAQWAK